MIISDINCLEASKIVGGRATARGISRARAQGPNFANTTASTVVNATRQRVGIFRFRNISSVQNSASANAN